MRGGYVACIRRLRLGFWPAQGQTGQRRTLRASQAVAGVVGKAVSMPCRDAGAARRGAEQRRGDALLKEGERYGQVAPTGERGVGGCGRERAASWVAWDWTEVASWARRGGSWLRWLAG